MHTLHCTALPGQKTTLFLGMAETDAGAAQPGPSAGDADGFRNVFPLVKGSEL